MVLTAYTHTKCADCASIHRHTTRIRSCCSAPGRHRPEACVERGAVGVDWDTTSACRPRLRFPLFFVHAMRVHAGLAQTRARACTPPNVFCMCPPHERKIAYLIPLSNRVLGNFPDRVRRTFSILCAPPAPCSIRHNVGVFFFAPTPEKIPIYGRRRCFACAYFRTFKFSNKTLH